MSLGRLGKTQEDQKRGKSKMGTNGWADEQRDGQTESKNVFRFFEFRLGINFFHFRLGRFGKVESRLGSPEAGVEISTG